MDRYRRIGREAVSTGERDIARERKRRGRRRRREGNKEDLHSIEEWTRGEGKETKVWNCFMKLNRRA